MVLHQVSGGAPGVSWGYWKLGSKEVGSINAHQEDPLRAKLLSLQGGQLPNACPCQDGAALASYEDMSVGQRGF